LRFNLVWFLHSDSPFLGKRKLLLAYQGCERRVATFYDLPGIPIGRPQDVLDGLPDAFADGIDYAQLVKVYGNDPEGATRYSPAQCLGTKREAIIGAPDQEHISTS
jgi:hypothetical protein